MRRFLTIKTLFSLSIFLLQSCSDNNLGQKLAESFDKPIIEEKSNLDNIPKKKSSISRKTSKVKIKKQDPILKNLVRDQSIKKENKIKRKKPIYNPQPYRITIKLSGANPSDPSESVTKVLINAGVNFEVEKIERISIDKSIDNSSFRDLRR